jgi:hypothetical protein
MTAHKRRSAARSPLTIVVLLVAVAAAAWSGMAAAQTDDKTDATETGERGYAAAEWRGASKGFGMVVKSSNVGESTTSVSWSNVPGMGSVVYNIHPDAPRNQDLLITFSADSKCNQDPVASVYCYIRVLVDGTEATPGPVAFNSVQHASNSTDTLAHGAHSMQWVAGPYGPGQHTITVQWQVDEGDAIFELWDRTLSVMGFYNNKVTVIAP